METLIVLLTPGTLFVLGGLRFAYIHQRRDGICVATLIAPSSTWQGTHFSFPPDFLVTELNPA